MRRTQFFWLLIMAFFLFGCDEELPDPDLNPPIVAAARGTENNLSIRLDWIEIGDNVGDIFGKGDLSFELFVIRSNGDSRRMSAPGQGTITVAQDDRFELNGFSLTVNEVKPDERILIYVLAYDQDALSFEEQSSASAALGAGEIALEQGLQSGRLGARAVTHSNIIAFIIAQVADTALSWWQEADLVGGYAVLLTPENNWLRNGTLQESDLTGNLRVSLSILSDTQSMAQASRTPSPRPPTTTPTSRPNATTTPLPPSPTSTPQTSIRPDPLDTITEYVALLNGRQYEQAFAILSDGFKERNHCCNADGSYSMQPYIDYWRTVERLVMVDLFLESQSDSQAVVNTVWRFERANTGDVVLGYQIELNYTNRWQIERVTFTD